MATAAAPTPAAPRRRRTHAERKAETRKRLIDAAWALFLEAGYEAASLNAIAARAGYTRTPIHQMFGDKPSLYAEVWRAKVREVGPEQLNLIARAKSVPELLRRLVDGIIAVQGDPTMHALRRLLSTMRVMSDGEGSAMERYILLELNELDRFAELLGRLSEGGPPLADQPRRVADRIGNYLGGLQELAHPRLNPIDADEAMGAMLTLAYGRLPDTVRHLPSRSPA